MKLQFESSQPHQLEAVRAVVDLFEGQPIAFDERGVANQLALAEEQILRNVQAVQERNGVARSDRLAPVRAETGEELTRLNFTVEMETGTGKTYTYLRTMYELNRIYGFKKFVIVVPSIAIREGAVKNLEVTHEHFQNLYGHPPIDFRVYDSGKLGSLRNYAASNAVQVLVINIDSFAKDTNVINTARETGVKPIEYIQATNPIVVVDEPQNMETPARKAAIHNLNPLCTLRYSATHKDFYNLVYSLNPVEAYDLGLVKQIEVDGVTAAADYNTAFVELKGIRRGAKTIEARLGLHVGEGRGVRRKDFKVGVGKDLYALSGGRDVYKDGFILNRIDAEAGEVEFSGGLVLRLGRPDAERADAVARFQLERAVRWHFEKVRRLKDKGVKVLTLIFIDKVGNYRVYDADGAATKGRFAVWFEEIFARYAAQPRYVNLIPHAPEAVHNGYFSQDRKGKLKDTRGNTDADRDTYGLIMKDKETLLSVSEPLQFIFSHSALREGWDNPNVFQICTLNETRSELKKRQEIGRGLRLPVDALGRRIQDAAMNVLTVVANETYEDFSRALQSEIEAETSVKFEGRIRSARDKARVRLTKTLTPEGCPLFFEVWEKIRQRTRYRVEFSTEDVIGGTVRRLGDFNQFPRTWGPRLEARAARLAFTREGIEGRVTDIGKSEAASVPCPVPDVFSYVQSRVDISRQTIYEILRRTGRAGELLLNPQMFLDNVVLAVRQTLDELLVEGVRYEKVEGRQYGVELFEAEEGETYLSNLFEVSRPEKTLYNYIPFESGCERAFARDCEADERVKFFFRLPRGFKIPTPLGDYRPDWAVVFHDDRKNYFVVETKGTPDSRRLREVEKLKIRCGEKHFAALDAPDLTYKPAVTNAHLP
jgi:type III restriction enzyme